jgi:hypothetical protein
MTPLVRRGAGRQRGFLMALGNIEIGDLDGFKNDRFDRFRFAERLEKSIVDAPTGTTIALDAEWGTGKTVFLKQFAGHLRTKGWVVARYDALSQDYEEDAFIPLMGAILDELPETAEGKKQALKDKAAPVLRRVLSTSLRFGTRFATAGILDTEEMGKAFEAAIAAQSKDFADRVAQSIEAGEAKRNELSEFIGALNATGDLVDQEKSDSAQVLIIVDELDRCRPEFAIQTLERIKHLFAGAQCKFLFGVNLPELAAIVKGYYGEAFSGRKYLQRFFEIEFAFPAMRYETPASIHLSELLNDRGNYSALTGFGKQLLESGALRFEVSLRDVERFVQKGKNNNPTETVGSAERVLLTFLFLVQICRPDDYAELVSVPPNEKAWHRLVIIDTLDSYFSSSIPALRSLLKLDQSSIVSSIDEDQEKLISQNFGLAKSRLPSSTSPGIINAYSKKYIEGGQI